MTYRLLHGDCLSLMNEIPDKSIDCVISDVPSGRTACVWDSVIPLEPMWAHLRRIIKPRGAIVLLGLTQPFTSVVVCSNLPMFKYDWVWEKDRATGALLVNYQPLRAHESIAVFGYESPNYNPQKTTGHKIGNSSSKTKQAGAAYRPYLMQQYIGNDERYPRSVQKVNVVNSAHNPEHPTQKPIALMEYLIRTYTHEGDTVLDFCMGSGSTGHAAANTRRNFIGIELYPFLDRPIDPKLNPNYFFDASARIADAYAPLGRMMEAVS